jgi:hypothetical protein
MLLLCGTVTPQNNNSKAGGSVQVKEITYDVGINNHDLMREYGPEGMADQWFRDNIEASTRCAWLNELFAAGTAGKLSLTDTNGRALNRVESMHMFYYCDTIRVVKPQPPYDEFDTVLCSYINPQKVVALRFRESWTMNTTTMEITKKVIAMAPLMGEDIMESGFPQKQTVRPMFWIVYDQKIIGNTLLTPRIVANTVFEKKRMMKPSDSSLALQYMKLLIDKATNEGISCYTFDENPVWDSPLSGKELYGRLYTTDTLNLVRNGIMYDTIIVHGINASAFRTLRFMEEWYFDEGTLQITKKVIGVCPVIEVYTDNGEFRGYKPLFWTYFSDVWMPFNRKANVKVANPKP